MQDREVVAVGSPVAGVVVEIEVGVGQPVDPDTGVATVDTDGTRMVVAAGVSGRIHEVLVQEGEAVGQGDALALVGPVEGEPADSQPAPGSSCINCGATGLEPGFMDDRGQHSGGYGRWVEGPLEVGFFGPRRMGRAHRVVEAYRCPRCFHLALFATDEV